MFQVLPELNAAQRVRKDVAEAIKGRQPSHLWRIAGRVKWQPSRVRIALEGMQKEGRVFCDKDGKWGEAR